MSQPFKLLSYFGSQIERGIFQLSPGWYKFVNVKAAWKKLYFANLWSEDLIKKHHIAKL